MRRTQRVLAVLTVILTAGIAGFWFGHQGVPKGLTPVGETPATSRLPGGPVLYYQDPDGKPLYSGDPAQTPDGRPYRAVRASEDLSFEVPANAPGDAASAPGGKPIRYYRNPMGLPDTSPTPKKDSMGMAYIPVYEGDDEDGTTVRLSPGKLQRIGVRTEPAALRIIAQPVRAPGSIQLDERRVSVISLRTEAYIETVGDVTSGSEVRKGQPLVRLFSQAIANAAAEYLSSGLPIRLLNLGVPEQFIAEVKSKHQVPLTFTWPAPRDSIVLERNVVDGQRVTPGDVMFRIADHSVVWALVDVAERDLAAVAEGQPVIVRVRSYPDRSFTGKVALVYPHLNSTTRTVRVRIELANHDLRLKPEMYAEAEIDTGGGTSVLAVPDDAVIDSGDRRIVIIDKGEGRFEPRPIEIGRRGAGYVEIKSGLAEGDVVVTSANFLIDAESNLQSALKTMTGPGAPQ